MTINKNYRISLHDIRLYVILHGVLLFLLRPYFTFLYGQNVITGPINEKLYLVSFIIGLFAFSVMFIGVAFTNVSGQIENFVSKVSTVSIKRFILVYLIWMFLYFLLNYQRLSMGFMTLLLQPQVEFIQSNSSFISNNLTGIYSFFIIGVFSIRSSKAIRIFLIIVVIIGALPIGIMSGSKTLVLNPLFLLLLRYSAYKKGIPIVLIMVFMAIGIPLFAGLELVRHQGLMGLANFFSGTGTDFNIQDILMIATNRFYGTDIIYSILVHHDFFNHPYLLGNSFVGLFFFLIPRFLWENKPVISFGKTISEEYLGSDFWSTGISAAPTWLGELFANFGYLSIPLYIICIYFIMRYIRSNFSYRTRAWRRVYFYPLAFTTLSFFQEASIAGWILQLLTLAVLCYFFSLLLHGRFFSNRYLK